MSLAFTFDAKDKGAAFIAALLREDAYPCVEYNGEEAPHFPEAIPIYSGDAFFNKKNLMKACPKDMRRMGIQQHPHWARGNVTCIIVKVGVHKLPASVVRREARRLAEQMECAQCFSSHAARRAAEPRVTL